METHSTTKPHTFFAIATVIIMLIVLLTVWQKTLHRPDIRGDWELTCENSITKRVSFSANEWTETQTIYADTACQQKAFTFQTVGTYELGDKSAEVEGATHAELIRRELHLTAFSMESAQAFEQYRCGNTKWEADVTTDISKTGCTGITTSISDCRTEYILIKRMADTLFLNDPTKRSCTHNVWPKTLSDSAYKKLN